MARAIARKAGLRQGISDPGGFNRTLFDAWVYPYVEKENLQWEVDLTGYTSIRFVSMGPLNPNFFLAYSLSGFGTQDLDPGDYALFPTLWPADPYGYPTSRLEAFTGNSEVFGGAPWAHLREDLRVPMRLALSLGTGSGTQWNWDWELIGWERGFSVAAQVR